MAIEYYKGFDTYVIYGEESVYGTAVAPSTTNFPGLIQSFSVTLANNSLRVQGLGDGRNSTSILLGPFDVSGSMDFQLNDPTFLQYAIGIRQGADSIANPYEIVESENIGFDAANIPSLTFEVGHEGDTVDSELTISGVVINNMTITATQGEIITASMDWVGQTVVQSATLQSVSAQTVKPFLFHDATCTVGSDTLQLLSFAVTVANNITPHRDLGSRLIVQPSAGLRRYDFTLTFKMKEDGTASTLDAVELRELLLGAASDTAPSAGISNASNTLSLDINEGTGASGERVLNIDLASASFDSWNQTTSLDGGVIEVTVSGMALSGLADGGDNVPIRWYTIA